MRRRPVWQVELRRWAITPRGQLQMIGLALLLAVVCAAFAASQRAFFEGYVREKYPEPSPRARALAGEMDRGDLDAQALAREPTSAHDGLYLLYMRAEPDTHLSPRLPALLAAAAPRLVCERIERTLVAGSPAQRARALELARTSSATALAPALRFALARAERSDDPLAEALRDALARLGESGRAATGTPDVLETCAD